MAELPSVPRRLVLTEAPRSSVSGADIASPYRMIGQAVGEFGAAWETANLARVEGEGAKSVVRGEDGSVSVAMRPEWSRSDASFNRGARVGYLAELSGLARGEYAEYARRFANDLDGLRTALQSATETHVAGAEPELVAPVRDLLSGLAEQTFAGAERAFFERRSKIDLGRIDAELARLDLEMAAVAHKGGMDTDGYRRLQAQYLDLWQEKISDPRFAVGEAEADFAISRANAHHAAEGLLGIAERRASAPPSSSVSIVDRIIGAESGGDATAANPNSTATGAGQFIEGTWLDLMRRHRPEMVEGKTDEEILSLRTDPALSREMVDALAVENGRTLFANGHAPTPAAVYLAHFLGPAGAIGVLDSDAHLPVRDALIAGGLTAAQADAAVAANASVLSGKTAADVIAWAEGKMGGGVDDPLAEIKAALADLALTPEEQRRYAGIASASISAMDAERKRAAAINASLVADDLASIASSGMGVIDVPEQMAAKMPPAEAAKYLADRQDAEDLWRATSDFGISSDEAIADRLTTLEPVAGSPGYARAARLYDDAAKKATAALKLRQSDPASAARAFPSVAAAEEAVDPNDPATLDRLIVERLAAQDALGIPELARDPLTNAEALGLSRVVTAALPGREQVAAMQTLVADVERRYGRHAPAVLRQVLTAQGIDRELASYGASLLTRLSVGQTAPAEDARAVDQLSDANAAEAATTAFPPAPTFRQIPNVAQISRLTENPQLAGEFDKKFGVGSAAFYLESARQRQDRWAGVTINADGTENFDPVAAAKSTPTRDAVIQRYRQGLSDSGVTGDALDAMVTRFTETFDARLKAMKAAE